MSTMQPNQSSSRSAVLIVGLSVAILLLIGATGFGVWAFGQRQDYKNNVDLKVSAAVAKAKQEESARKDAEFAELSKSPLKSYVGPEAYGSVNLKYPKTWSGYVAVTSNGSPYVDGYFNPNVVPNVSDSSSSFALRMRVTSDSYSTVMEGFTSNAQDGTSKVTPYKLPRVGNVIGSKVVGQLDNDKKGTMIVLPLRANALEIWTESDQYLNDFNKYILPNLTFAP